ncbi:hypothetical protein KKC32_02705 [Patescibacteria group bacterium]|nr:hypothetical protein [Patescibacteria group bacterium]
MNKQKLMALPIAVLLSGSTLLALSLFSEIPEDQKLIISGGVLGIGLLYFLLQLMGSSEQQTPTTTQTAPAEPAPAATPPPEPAKKAETKKTSDSESGFLSAIISFLFVCGLIAGGIYLVYHFYPIARQSIPSDVNIKHGLLVDHNHFQPEEKIYDIFPVRKGEQWTLDFENTPIAVRIKINDKTRWDNVPAGRNGYLWKAGWSGLLQIKTTRKRNSFTVEPAN